MKKNLQTTFSARQYMLSKDFELYYYSDSSDSRLLSRVQAHSHDYYEFYFFLEGDVSIQIGGCAHPLKPGDLVLIPPDISHRAIVHNTVYPYRRFVFWISRAFFNRLQEESPDYAYVMTLAQSGGYYIHHYDLIAFNTLQSRIFQLLEEIHADHFGKAVKISLGVQELILHLNRTIYEKEHPIPSDEMRSLCQDLIRYIEAHLEEELSLDRLAQVFYVSKYHIAHVFKENFGLSVHQFITKKRLSMCRDSILGRQEISKTYFLYGFKDYSSFFRAFRKEFGMSPKEYARRYCQPAAALDHVPPHSSRSI